MAPHKPKRETRATSPLSEASKPKTRGRVPLDGVISEFEAIHVLTRKLTQGIDNELLSVGLGDDAAVLRQPHGELVCSVDASLEGVHFNLKWLSLEQAARRAFHAAVSDLAAMGAKPLAALVALEVPHGTLAGSFQAIARGQARAVRDTNCPIVGGNIARSRGFGFTTTVLGTCPRGTSVTRSGAQPGDEVWLSDEVGWAGFGLSLLQSEAVVFTSHGYQSQIEDTSVAAVAARRWSAPRAKVDTGLEWAKSARSMIDISDSLASEAHHLAEASKAAVILVGRQLLKVHPRLTRAAKTLERDTLSMVLYGGEDYALLATGPSEKRPPRAKVVGRVEPGHGAFLELDGQRHSLGEGFDHLVEQQRKEIPTSRRRVPASG
jgi:thiamine-monophosphate kinase